MDKYCFFDGDDDPNSHNEGPHLSHYRSTTLEDIRISAKTMWDKVQKDQIEVPITSIQMYDNLYRHKPAMKMRTMMNPESNVAVKTMRMMKRVSNA